MLASRRRLDGVGRLGIAARNEIREGRGGSPGEVEEELSQRRRANPGWNVNPWKT